MSFLAGKKHKVSDPSYYAPIIADQKKYVRQNFLEKIKLQAFRMGERTKKLMGITRYETMDYVFEGERIIDIDRASATA